MYIYTVQILISCLERFSESAQLCRSSDYYHRRVPGFRSDSSLYCYSSVSYGQKMTTLIRQIQRICIYFPINSQMYTSNIFVWCHNLITINNALSLMPQNITLYGIWLAFFLRVWIRGELYSLYIDWFAPAMSFISEKLYLTVFIPRK